MGCGALKKIFRGKSRLQKNLNRPFSQAMEELFLSNGHNPFLPMVCKTNNVAKKFLPTSDTENIPSFISKHNEGEKLMSLETYVGLKLDPELGNLLKEKSSEEHKAAETESNEYEPTEEEKTETINTWELMEGLDDGETCNVSKFETHSDTLSTNCGDDNSAMVRNSGRSKYLKSFDKEEDYDARAKRPLWDRNSKRQLYYLGHDHLNGKQENCASMMANIGKTDMVQGNSEKDQSPEPGDSGERRIQVRAKLNELGGIMIPTTPDFSAVGSLKEWLHEGGHSYSSLNLSIDDKTNCEESSVYSDFDDSTIDNKQWEYLLFDPELLALFEKDLEQVFEEEQHLLQQINGELNLMCWKCCATENEDGLQESNGTEHTHMQSIFLCHEG